jgi:hypothetical protein
MKNFGFWELLRSNLVQKQIIVRKDLGRWEGVLLTLSRRNKYHGKRAQIQLVESRVARLKIQKSALDKRLRYYDERIYALQHRTRYDRILRTPVI